MSKDNVIELPTQSEEAIEEEEQTVRIEIQVKPDGNISLGTNLDAFGTIHTLAEAIKVITVRVATAEAEQEEE